VSETNLIDSERKTFIDVKGKEHIFQIGKVPWMGGGREILAEYIPSGLPKVGDYQKNETLARILYANAVKIDSDGNHHPLTTDSMINNHVPDVKVAMELEAAVFDKSTDFLILGKVLEYRTAWSQTLDSVLADLPTQLQKLLSGLASPPLPNSEKKPASKKRTPSTKSS